MAINPMLQHGLSDPLNSCRMTVGCQLCGGAIKDFLQAGVMVIERVRKVRRCSSGFAASEISIFYQNYAKPLLCEAISCGQSCYTSSYY